MEALSALKSSRRVVIKIGSALLVDAATGHLRADWLQGLCEDINALKSDGKDVIIVSSGAIALGRQRLGLTARKLTLPEKQACASAGQSALTQAYEKALGTYDRVTAQALLTLNDTENRRRWLNARSTLETLLKLGAIPIINENDTVATDEIRYGDNDRLAARTAQMLAADSLILLSDIDGLYTSDPRINSDAQHIPVVNTLDATIMSMGGAPNAKAQVGTGGMATKLLAAQIAVEAGCHMCVMNGEAAHPIRRLLDGDTATWFSARKTPLRAKQQWIHGSLKPRGSLSIDIGAANALEQGKSLLAAGITSVKGSFKKGDSVKVVDSNGTEVARGLSSYNADDIAKIIGLKSSDIPDTLGYDNGDAVIHRDNLVRVK